MRWMLGATTPTLGRHEDDEPLRNWKRKVYSTQSKAMNDTHTMSAGVSVRVIFIIYIIYPIYIIFITYIKIHTIHNI